MEATTNEVERLIREIAGVDEGESNRAAIERVGAELGLSQASLYKLIKTGNAGRHARALLDAADKRRGELGLPLTTIDDLRAITEPAR